MENIDSFYQGLGKTIREKRKERGWNQEQLATKSDLNRVSIVNIEQGSQKVMLHTLIDIAKALEVPLAQLLDSGNTSTEYSEIKKQLDTPEAHRLGKLFFDEEKS